MNPCIIPTIPNDGDEEWIQQVGVQIKEDINGICFSLYKNNVFF